MLPVAPMLPSANSSSARRQSPSPTRLIAPVASTPRPKNAASSFFLTPEWSASAPSTGVATAITAIATAVAAAKRALTWAGGSPLAATRAK